MAKRKRCEAHRYQAVNLKNLAEKIWREYEEKTGVYMRPWLSAFARGPRTLYSPTPMPLLVWGPKARDSHLDSQAGNTKPHSMDVGA